MGYRRSTERAYGITLGKSERFTGKLSAIANDPIEYFGALEEFVFDNYPLLEVEGAGDYRYDDLEVLVVVKDTLTDEFEVDDFVREGNLLPTHVEADNGDDVSAEAAAELKKFMDDFEVTATPARLTWQYIS